MRIGFAEIASILFIILGILFSAVMLRTFRGNSGIAGKGKPAIEAPERQVEQSSPRKGRQLKLTGVVLILIAVLLLLSGMSVLRWVLRAYLWSFILLAIGLAILFLSRKR